MNKDLKIALVSDAHSYWMEENDGLITNWTVRFSWEVTKVAEDYCSEIMLLTTSSSYNAFNSESIHVLENERFLYNNLPQSSQTHWWLAENDIINYLDEFQPDIVSIPTIWAPNASIAQLWAKNNNIPLVATIHSHPWLLVRHTLWEMWYDTETVEKISKKVKRKIQTISNDINTIIVRSSTSLDQLQEWWLNWNYKVLRWWIDKTVYRPCFNDFEKISLREKYNLNLESKLILFVWRFCPAKESDSILLILEKLREIDDSIELVVVGNNTHYESSLESLKLKWVNFVGELWKNETSEVIRSTDFWIAPSEEETFGQAIAEMMSSWLTCAVPKNWWHRDFANETNSLLLDTFNVNDSESWVSSIYETLLDADKREWISLMARKSIWDINDSYEDFIKIHRKTYEDSLLINNDTPISKAW